MAKICLDLGHGGKDAGAVNGIRYEKNDNLRMGLKVADILRSYGHTVITTRTTDVYMGLGARSRIANNNHADYFLSIHRNSTTNHTAKGIEIWVHHNASATSIKVASAILKNCLAVTPVTNRGVCKGYPGKPNEDFSVNELSNMPSALLELSFISNSDDNAKYDKCFNEYAKAVADGICDGLGISKTAPSIPIVPPTSKKYYRVQVGSFLIKANADKMLDRLKADGFDGYITKYKQYNRVQIGAFEVKQNAENLKMRLKAKGYSAYIEE